MENFKKYKNQIGWLSAFLIVAAYFLMTINVAESKSILYNLMNLIGGTGLAYRVYLDKNWSNFTLELIFVLIALINLYVYFN